MIADLNFFMTMITSIFPQLLKKFLVSSTICQDAILHEKYFDEEIKGKLILGKNSSTLN